MSKIKPYKVDNISFWDDKKINSSKTKHLLRHFKRIRATERMVFSWGWCCEAKCFHYTQEAYIDEPWVERELYNKLHKYASKLKSVLDNRENIT